MSKTPSPSLGSQLNVRLPEELRNRVDKACVHTGLDAATVVRACLAAFVDSVELMGEIRLPLEIIPKTPGPVSDELDIIAFDEATNRYVIIQKTLRQLAMRKALERYDNAIWRTIEHANSGNGWPKHYRKQLPKLKNHLESICVSAEIHTQYSQDGLECLRMEGVTKKQVKEILNTPPTDWPHWTPCLEKGSVTEFGTLWLLHQLSVQHLASRGTLIRMWKDFMPSTETGIYYPWKLEFLDRKETPPPAEPTTGS